MLQTTSWIPQLLLVSLILLPYLQILIPKPIALSATILVRTEATAPAAFAPFHGTFPYYNYNS